MSTNEMKIVIVDFRCSELEATLLLLPFDYVQKLFVLLLDYLERFQSPELCVKCVVFLMKIHHVVLTSSSQYLNLVEQLRMRSMETVEQLRVRRDVSLMEKKMFLSRLLE